MTPRMWFPQNLDRAARQIGGLIQALHDQSRSTKLMYRLHFNMSKGQYWVTFLNGPNESPVSDTLFQGHRSLPEDVQFQDVMIGHSSRGGESDTFMQFFPVGRVDPTVIHLMDQEEVVSLLVHPVTGTVRIEKGHVVPRGWKNAAM